MIAHNKKSFVTLQVLICDVNIQGVPSLHSNQFIYMTYALTKCIPIFSDEPY